MKILQVIQFFNPKFGGSMNVCYNLSKELAKLGHEVTIITTDIEFDEKYTRSIQSEKVKVINFKCTLNVASFLYSPSMKKWLNNHILEFDIIHVHNFRTYQNSLIQRYAKKHNIPYILQAHGSLPLIIEKQGLKRFYDLIWGKKILNDAAALIAVSNVEVQQYKQLGIDKDRIIIVPNGIDIEEYNKNTSPGKFKLTQGITTEYMILYLGRIHQIKGLKFLIESFKQVSNSIENVSLLIAGPDDGYKTELENFVKSLKIKNVKFIDYVKNVSEAYSDADLLVYPAIYEIFGLVPFEAIACGTPIIVTKDCGCGELVKEGECGFVVNYNNLDELSSKINYLLKNPEVGFKMVDNGKKYIKNNLLWNEIVMKVEKLYENCICNI